MILNKLDQQYLNIAQDIIDNGNRKVTRNAVTYSVFSREIRHSFTDGFPLYTTKQVSISNVFTELKWFLLGRTDLKWLLDRNCNIWVGDVYKKYVNDKTSRGEEPLIKSIFMKYIQDENPEVIEWNDMGKIYGKQWRDFNGVDQIVNMINSLKNDPNSRRILLNAWNASDLDEMLLPPCHLYQQYYTFPLNGNQKLKLALAKGVEVSEIKDTGLNLWFLCRSQDYFLGTPYNTVSYALLQQIVGAIVSMEPYEIIHSMGDTHIYEGHMDAVSKQLKNKGHELPTLSLTGEFNNIEEYWENGEFRFDEFIDKLTIEDFIVDGYKSDGIIKAPLFN